VATINYRRTEVDGLKVFYREGGRADALTLLLLHGFPSAGHMFCELMPQLGERFHVVAPDLPGFGQSEMPSRDKFHYTFLTRPGADEVQLDLLGDYKSNVALYPEFQSYFRKFRPPFLAAWGKNDPFFLPAGAEAFKRGMPKRRCTLL
jgi:alpha-beta hydrolase superfamily lysophospholipase